MKKKPVVIGIIMTYNCSPMLKDTYRNIPKGVFNKLIVVDDESTDDSREVARLLNLPVFRHKHLGYGGNIKYGLKKAAELGADYMVEIHGDGQYSKNLRLVPTVIKRMASENYDFILGTRFTNMKQALKDGMPIARFFANIVLSAIDRIILQLSLTEFHSGFRVYSKKLVKTVEFKGMPNDHLFSFALIVKTRYCGLKLGDIPVRCDYKKQHTSISMRESIIYSFQTRGVLLYYLLAKFNFKKGIFKYQKTK